MKHFFTILIVGVFYGCAVLGSKTTYKSNIKFEFKKIGCAKLFNSKEFNAATFDVNSILFRFLKKEYLYNLGDTILFIDRDINFNFPSKEDIIDICLNNNLNGLMLPKMKLIRTTEKMYGVTIAEYFNTEVQLKLYDNNGNLIISTLHNTQKGNTYFKAPKLENTIYDGATGALQKLLKEYHLLK